MTMVMMNDDDDDDDDSLCVHTVNQSDNRSMRMRRHAPHFRCADDRKSTRGPGHVLIPLPFTADPGSTVTGQHDSTDDTYSYITSHYTFTGQVFSVTPSHAMMRMMWIINGNTRYVTSISRLYIPPEVGPLNGQLPGW